MRSFIVSIKAPPKKHNCLPPHPKARTETVFRCPGLLSDLAPAPEDPIYRVRGMLKGKKGGTAVFTRDKQEEIEKEYRL